MTLPCGSDTISTSTVPYIFCVRLHNYLFMYVRVRSLCKEFRKKYRTYVPYVQSKDIGERELEPATVLYLFSITYYEYLSTTITVTNGTFSATFSISLSREREAERER